jgi:hypothetical protein
MPPWYQLVPLQFEPTSKLSYHKFQYFTYVKDINLDAHIRVFKKVIKANGETMEANIINLFGFTLRNNISYGVKILYKIILIAQLMNWSKHFTSIFKS